VSPKEGDHVEEQGRDGRKRDHGTLKKLDAKLWNGLIWHNIRINERCTEHGNEKTGSVKIRGFPA